MEKARTAAPNTGRKAMIGRMQEFCVQERYSFVLIEKLKEIRSNLVKRFDGYTEPEFVL